MPDTVVGEEAPGTCCAAVGEVFVRDVVARGGRVAAASLVDEC